MSPPVTSHSSSLSYVGPYEDFLELQKDKYSVDSDGKIRVYNEWSSKEMEDPIVSKVSPDDTGV